MRLDMSRIVAPRLAPHHRYRPVPSLAPSIDSDAPHDEGLYQGEPEACRRDLSQFLPVLLHLGLLLGVAHAYRLEDGRFVTVLGVALAALPIHYYLPFRAKKPFFVAISILALGLIVGAATALAVLPVALALIALAAAPIAWKWKVSAMTLACASLACLRAGLGEWIPFPVAAWPVLGSMLMFRMIIYLYELKHAREPEPLIDTVGYFFLLPNFCFLHFPVVDYRTWLRGYFATDIHVIQRRGVGMILRGMTHLLIYRLVYHELLITPEEVVGTLSLLRYLAANYLLYLHVSGQFHVACGLLHLFGHQLPETHHHFLLATGFTDYWRRINIYWKDFMVRVVFNPVVFRLKRRPQTVALAVATSVVFLATWVLHAYQSFWLGGHWGFSVPDALFWGILGALVIVNVQLDARRGRVAPPRSPGEIRMALVVRAAKIVGTLATISVLWSLWTSDGVRDWLEMMRRGLLGVAE